MKVTQNLGIVSKNENSTEHFVHLHTIGPVNIVHEKCTL